MSKATFPALLKELEVAITCPSRNRIAVLSSLERLLLHLNSNDTHENCSIVSSYIQSLYVSGSLEWVSDDARLILEDMANILDDTHSHRHIAENFDSTPGQLLRRIRTLMK